MFSALRRVLGITSREDMTSLRVVLQGRTGLLFYLRDGRELGRPSEMALRGREPLLRSGLATLERGTGKTGLSLEMSNGPRVRLVRHNDVADGWILADDDFGFLSRIADRGIYADVVVHPDEDDERRRRAREEERRRRREEEEAEEARRRRDDDWFDSDDSPTATSVPGYSGHGGSSGGAGASGSWSEPSANERAAAAALGVLGYSMLQDAEAKAGPDTSGDSAKQTDDWQPSGGAYDP